MGLFSKSSSGRAPDTRQERAAERRLANGLHDASSRGQGDRIARAAGYRDAEEALADLGSQGRGAGWRR
jgi:hypothetical protein